MVVGKLIVWGRGERGRGEMGLILGSTGDNLGNGLGGVGGSGLIVLKTFLRWGRLGQ